MSGIVNTTPTIIKTLLVDILTVEELYNLHSKEKMDIWTNSGWLPIKDIRREKTSKKIFRISNCYNWIYLTEDCKLLLENGETIKASEIKASTKLLSIEFPKSNFIDVSMPLNLEPEHNKFADLNDEVLFNLQVEHWNRIMDYINSKNLEAAKQAFLNLRHNFQSFTTVIWDLKDAQKRMYLGKKAGYNPKLHQSCTFHHIRFNDSFEAWKSDESYLRDIPGAKLDYSYEKYLEFLKNYSEEYKVYPMMRQENKAYEVLEGKIFAANHTMRHDYEMDYVYQIITETGFHQAGAGGLIVGY